MQFRGNSQKPKVFESEAKEVQHKAAQARRSVEIVPRKNIECSCGLVR